eukprot:15438903-Alexandrium_andersonii.AAC.1
MSGEGRRASMMALKRRVAWSFLNGEGRMWGAVMLSPLRFTSKWTRMCPVMSPCDVPSAVAETAEANARSEGWSGISFTTSWTHRTACSRYHASTATRSVGSAREATLSCAVEALAPPGAVELAPLASIGIASGLADASALALAMSASISVKLSWMAPYSTVSAAVLLALAQKRNWES